MEAKMMGKFNCLHDHHKSDVVSLALTVLNMARLEESGGLNLTYNCRP
jgi:hypothetical protein